MSVDALTEPGVVRLGFFASNFQHFEGGWTTAGRTVQSVNGASTCVIQTTHARGNHAGSKTS